MLSRFLPTAIVERARDESGVGVATALFISLIVFGLGLTWTQLGIHDVQLSSHERAREQSLDSAEAGINLAMAQLTADSGFVSSSGTLAGGSGEYDVTVEPINPVDPADMRRKIVATGYAPNRTDPSGSVRVLESEVDLESTDGFDFALFSNILPLQLGNNASVSGPIYAAGGLQAGNDGEFAGDVRSPLGIQLGNGTLVEGDVAGDQTVSIGNDSVLHGGVFAGDDASLGNETSVAGAVQAGGNVSTGNGVTVVGGIAENSAPPPVSQESTPVFTWSASNYSPPGTAWSSTSSFYSNWATKATAGLPFNGHHKINDSNKLTLDKKSKMNADVTIVTDGEVLLEKDITNTTSDTLDLVIVSTHANGIEIKNGVAIPDSIRVLLFAPNGKITTNNSKHFTGAMYAKEIAAGNSLDVTWARIEAPGFSWTTSSVVHHRVVVRVLREVTA